MGNLIMKDFRAPQFNERGCQAIKNAAMRNGYDLDQWDEERMLGEEKDRPDLTLIEKKLLSKIETLWILCHPDRHPDNQQTALEATAWLQRVKMQLGRKQECDAMEDDCPF
jgi:hypothetical protein